MAERLQIGRRRDDGTSPHLFEPGDYGLWEGSWWCCCPAEGVSPDEAGGNLAAHAIELHEDRTITVTPSILVRQGDREVWHGWLERGVWREA